ncbi:MAG: serine/threonine protein kinase, partial [Actinomycetota bacterium]|nr:serine/threonine protein kinase [Actinomycetota bacterium]
MTASDDPGIPGCINFHLIKRGGFSRVYRAEQPSNDRLVAVKVLAIEFGNQRLRKQFQRECQAAGRLSTHPNIITVLESGFTDSDEAYLMMDFHAQGSLGDRLSERGAMELDRVLQVGLAIAGALETAHEAKVLHRDVKPENILISDFGDPILADFGIATVIDQLTRTSLIDALTPAHAAPELFENASPSPACDVYSLGSTLYQLLAGRPAFPPRRDEGVLAYGRRVTEEPVPPILRADLPPQVFDLLSRSMSKRPEDRPVSAVALANDLQVVQRELGYAVTDPTLPASSSATGKAPRSASNGVPEFSFEPDPPVPVKRAGTSTVERKRDGDRMPVGVGASDPSSPGDIGSGAETIRWLRPRRKTAGKEELLKGTKPKRLSLAVGLGVAIGLLAVAGLALAILLGGSGRAPG